MRPRRLFPLLVPALLALALTAGPARSEEVGKPAPAPEKAIDLVICLDTSGSMEGLIDSARKKLWSVVSELATAKPAPDLRVALLTYGSPGNDAAGHVILQSDLTLDLDLISERLFALGTRGGNEYVGRVVFHALEHCTWRDGALRVLFVAGNESADQDKVKPFRDQAKRAVGMDVVVNAIYCGGADDGDGRGYRELAALGMGRFANIDHNHGTVAIETPFDRELAELSSKVNKTYVAYGGLALESRERQVAQDENAKKAGAPAAADRAKAKAGRLYRNSAWDLVDRLEEEGFDLAKIEAEALPEEMRKMTLEERKAHLLKKKTERAQIQKQILELSGKRDAYVKDAMAKEKLDDSQALDRALRGAIREQAERSGFTFESE